jgi:hypothetical protein
LVLKYSTRLTEDFPAQTIDTEEELAKEKASREEMREAMREAMRGVKATMPIRSWQ